MQPNPVIDTAGFYEALAGELIADRYELRQFIKVGGSSGVFEAADRVMARTVAVKMMPSGDQTMEQRFEREAQILSRLHHPNTLTVYDFGRAEKKGQTYLYMVMEYLDGRSLKDLLVEEGFVAPVRAVRIVSQICRSLWDAHRHGIVHRDIKPSNVFLVHCDEDPEFVKVLDFGVARLLNITQDHIDHDMTVSGRIIGTPRYMSPEQISSQPVDARADVYSTGVLLYEMLTGRVPFQDSTLGGLLILHLKEPPPPFSAHDFPFADDVTDELEQGVRRSLAKRPEDRFASIDDFRTVIEGAVGISSPAKYADRRSSAPKPTPITGQSRVSDLNAPVAPPPVPDDASPGPVVEEDPEGIVLTDPGVSEPREDEYEATRLMANATFPHGELPRISSRHTVSPEPVVFPDVEELADEPDPGAMLEPRPSRRGRWMAAAIFLLLLGSVALTVALPAGEVPRVERLRAQQLQVSKLSLGALPDFARVDEADPLTPPAPVVESASVGPEGAASDVESMDVFEIVLEDPDHVVDSLDGTTRPAVAVEASAPERGTEAAPVEDVSPKRPTPPKPDKPIVRKVVRPAPTPVEVHTPKPPTTPAHDKTTVVKAVASPKGSDKPPVASGKNETKKPVVPLLDDGIKPKKSNDDKPRVAAPVVPLLD